MISAVTCPSGTRTRRGLMWSTPYCLYFFPLSFISPALPNLNCTPDHSKWGSCVTFLFLIFLFFPSETRLTASSVSSGEKKDKSADKTCFPWISDDRSSCHWCGVRLYDGQTYVDTRNMDLLRHIWQMPERLFQGFRGFGLCRNITMNVVHKD